MTSGRDRSNAWRLFFERHADAFQRAANRHDAALDTQLVVGPHPELFQSRVRMNFHTLLQPRQCLPVELPTTVTAR